MFVGRFNGNPGRVCVGCHQSVVGSQVAQAGAGVSIPASLCVSDFLADRLLHVVIEDPRYVLCVCERLLSASDHVVMLRYRVAALRVSEMLSAHGGVSRAVAVIDTMLASRNASVFSSLGLLSPPLKPLLPQFSVIDTEPRKRSKLWYWMKYNFPELDLHVMASLFAFPTVLAVFVFVATCKPGSLPFPWCCARKASVSASQRTSGQRLVNK
jgi:hypothetical protein